MAMIVNGFIEPIARELPMEYALEWSTASSNCRWKEPSADAGTAGGPSRRPGRTAPLHLASPRRRSSAEPVRIDLTRGPDAAARATW
jgi:hypothetical protein